jgi:hypothetical protein
VNQQDGGIYISTGFETYVSMSKTTNSIQTNLIQCTDTLDEFASMGPYNQVLRDLFDTFHIENYDQFVCNDVCYEHQLITQCSCSEYAGINITNICLTDAQIKCVANFSAIYFSPSNTNQQCIKACVPRCNSIVFSLVSSTAAYPTDSHINYLVNKYPKKFPSNLTVDPFRLHKFGSQSLIRLIVNYNSYVSTQLIEASALTLQSFIGQVGGNLGLFIGT